MSRGGALLAAIAILFAVWQLAYISGHQRGQSFICEQVNLNDPHDMINVSVPSCK